jgi:hypothetical protein
MYGGHSGDRGSPLPKRRVYVNNHMAHASALPFTTYNLRSPHEFSHHRRLRSANSSHTLKVLGGSDSLAAASDVVAL